MVEQTVKSDRSQPLSSAELNILAEQVPEWDISYGVANGVSYKSYSRVIWERDLVPDRRTGGELAHDTYLSLADYDHTDLGLAQIFGTYSFSGDAIRSRDDHYRISIQAENPGPITYDDFAMVVDAEAYLVEQGYLLPKEDRPEISEPAYA
jgi:hypothetical protein